MGLYHVIALKNQQPCCMNCKHCRVNDSWLMCDEGIDPDANGFVYDEDCPDVEAFGVCDKHQLDIPKKPDVTGNVAIIEPYQETTHQERK